jgi:GNAT superfamily N-acetyltransferase
MSAVSVRAVEAGDFTVVTRLLEELGRARVVPETRDECRRLMLDQLADPDAAHLLAEHDGGAVAMCTLHFRRRLNYVSPEAWIPDLVVTRAARRRGAARALLAEAERLARERGCWNLTLESGYGRTEAHALYGALGMEDRGKYFGKALS